MKISKSKFVELTSQIGKSFRTFGGGQTCNYNPLVNALKDKDYQFAAGVEVGSVLAFVLRELKIEVKE